MSILQTKSEIAGLFFKTRFTDLLFAAANVAVCVACVACVVVCVGVHHSVAVE